ncbi:hypothetical protein [Salsipaludibacter albus]|uniref:hypothetical protein n=1 Tax=Salsipaludibacter albus TaxID=2849650 RepID=UPI001EE3E1EB|nr:hypothetical protein [Salsipaludibacter albus]MBY5161611.1 hypothetical protein [Salsipaludibacter albus]
MTTPLVTRRTRLETSLVVLTLVQVVLVVVQGLTAGHVLTGNRTFVLAHEIVGANVIGFVSIAQIVVVGLLLRARLVRPWLLVLAVVAFGLVVAQVFLGFDGRMALHVPNALLVLVAQGVLLVGGRRDPRTDTA